MSLESYKLQLNLRIDWSELDVYNHVNNVAFIKYLQAGRVNFWEVTGLAKHHKIKNIGPMLVSTHCDFKKQLTYPGQIVVHTKVSHIGNTSFSLEHCIVNENRDICALGKDVAVCFNFNTQNSYPIPDWLKTEMLLYS